MEKTLDLIIQDHITNLEKKLSSDLHSRSHHAGIQEDEDAWTVRIFYKYERKTNFQETDNYHIQVSYMPNDDSRQQRHKFNCSSHDMHFFNRVVKSIFAYVTKTIVVDNVGGEIYPEGMSIEEITDRLNIKIERGM